MRYENKFVFDSSSYELIKNKILLSPFFFNEIYYERKVNNIYLDSYDLENYNDNLIGTKNRIKQRIRWYGNDKNVISPLLEYKIKYGEMGMKKYYSLPDFIIDDKFDYNNYYNCIKDSADKYDSDYLQMINDINQKRPTLYNSYNRVYFISGDLKYRITIDRTQKFEEIGDRYLFSHSFMKDNIIVELKYEQEDICGVADILQFLDFRLTRNSKYITGIRGLYFNDISY